MQLNLQTIDKLHTMPNAKTTQTTNISKTAKKRKTKTIEKMQKITIAKQFFLCFAKINTQHINKDKKQIKTQVSRCFSRQYRTIYWML